MKVRLLESAHDTWAPARTVGELIDLGNNQPCYRFRPESGVPVTGLWIGRVKWEEVVETATVNEPVKPRKRGK